MRKRVKGPNHDAAATSPAHRGVKRRAKQPARRSVAATILDSLESTRKVAVNLAIVLLAVFGTIAVMRATFRHSVTIDAIQMPKELADLGYTEDIARKHIYDNITNIVQASRTTKVTGLLGTLREEPNETVTTPRGAVLRAEESKLPEFELSFSGVSLGTLVSLFRNVVGITDTKVGGDVILEDAETAAAPEARPDADAQAPTLAAGPDGKDAETVKPAQRRYHLTLRIDGRPIDPPDNQLVGTLDDIFRRGAVRIVEHFDPYIAAAYLFETRDYDRARRRIATCLATCDNEYRPWLLNLRGSVARAEHNPQDAVADYTEAIAADANFALAYYNRALVHLDQFDYGRAFDDATAGTQKETIPHRKAIGLNHAGRALYFKGEKEQALTFFEQSIAANKTFGPAYHYRAVTLRDLNRGDEARAMFEMAIALDPQNAEASNQLGLLLLADKKWELARARFAAAAALRAVAPYFYNMGRALQGERKFDQAITAFEKATKLSPEHAWSYCEWGATLALKGGAEKETGVADATKQEVVAKLTRATSILPKNVAVLVQCGAVYEKLHMYAEALQTYQRPDVQSEELVAAARKVQQMMAGQ